MADSKKLTDFRGREDAGVYQISRDIALVQTIVFFPPVVDGPRLFGAIAAAKTLSTIIASAFQKELQPPVAAMIATVEKEEGRIILNA